MDKSHKPILFSSFSEAEKITSATRPNIIRCLNGTSKTAQGFIFFDPEEIEITDDAGKTNFDKEKLDMLIKRADEYLSNPYITEKMPIYAIYIGEKDKEDARFDTIREAINKLKISHRSINACLSKESEFAGDYCFIHANDVETIKEDGTVDVNQDKIDELRKKAKIASESDTCVRGKAIYAIKADDLSATRFEKSAMAAHALGISPANVSTCLSGRKLTTNGYYFIPAYKIETENSDDEAHEIDGEKLLETIEELKTKYEEYKASKSKKTAAKSVKKSSSKKTVKQAPRKELSTPANPIIKTEFVEIKTPFAESEYTEPEKPSVSVEAKAAEKDSGTNGTIQTKKDRKIETIQPDMVSSIKIVVDEKQKPVKIEFPIEFELCEELSPKETKEVSNTQKPKKQATSKTTDTKKEETPVSKQKKATAKKSAPKKHNYKRLGRVYALKNSGDYLEFKDLPEAAKHFNVETEFLYSVLKSIDGKYKGMLFSCDADG